MEQTERRRALAVLGASLALGAAYRLYVAFTDDGIFWPDEIYQSLEPAHRLVFGYGLVPWEFIEGARNWTLPGFIAALLKFSAVLGLNDPRQYLSSFAWFCPPPAWQRRTAAICLRGGIERRHFSLRSARRSSR